MTLRIKRIYDDVADDDGCRVLVDRLWPRGVAKERAHLDAWLKEIAPSPVSGPGGSTIRIDWTNSPFAIVPNSTATRQRCRP